MEKQTAIQLLGGTPKKAAEAMGYKTVHAIYVWPDVLPQSTADQVIGAATRLKLKYKPKQATTPASIAQPAINTVAEA